ncbi:MAG: VWA domain-containing protein [Actinobacteria bacterium]|nr:VWA domain-containing protein [Actinomycetota bacterium]
MPRFPFSAVVGHDEVKLALLLNALDPRIGGVLLRGEKGSAKSTLARGLAALLAEGAPFVELPIGATEDRVVGSLDIQAALTGGAARLRPGLLAAADGGVLYVDEVNLLPDHLVDVLLDVAASGVNRVEREGVSASHPSRFVLIGSMNPEEGDLRPQLLDRFGLAVEVTSSGDADERAEAVQRRLAFDHDSAAFSAVWEAEEEALRRRLREHAAADLPDGLVRTISSLCASVGAEGLRADLVICRAATALAGWEGRDEVTVDDVRRVAPLALGHRRRRSPFEEPGIDPQEIDDGLREQQEHRHDPAESESEDGSAGGDRHAAPGDTAPVVALAAPRQTGAPPSGGRRSPAEGSRGRLVGDRPVGDTVGSLALGATVRAAVERRAADGDDQRLVTAGDLREAVRQERVGNLLVLAVDASGSMGAQQRMEAVKGAVLSLLLDAYQRRDRVALVTFRDDRAEVVLRPTGSVEVARGRMADLRTGGRTPLAAGIERALQVATAAGPGAHRPLLVLVSDGRATSAPAGQDPVEAAMAVAATARRHAVPSVVIDAESGDTRLGLAARLAEAMGADLVPLPELTASALTGAIRRMTP